MKGCQSSWKPSQGIRGALLALLSFLVSSAAMAGTCTVDATQTNQFIHCIGASSAWSGINGLGTQLFADDNVNGHIGLQSLRARIDPNNNFSPEISTLAAAKAVNPNILLWATEWSPPAQYKANNNVNGGASNDTFLGAGSGSPNSADTGLANYQVSFIQACKNQGVNLYALSIQNEPNFNPTYEACLWTAGQFDVYAQAFHSAIQNAGFSTKIMLPEPDNTFGMNLASTAMDDPTVAPMIGIIGTHLYGSPNPGPLSSFGFTHVTNQEWWETEMSGNTTDWPGALQEVGWIQNCLVNSGMNAFHYWWIQDLYSGGSLDIKAYVLGNYSKFIRPGYYRMGATAVPSSGVSVSAYKNTNNSSPQTIVFVAINGNSSSVNQTFSINGVNVTSVTPWVTDGSNNLVAKSPVAVSGGSFSYNLTGPSVTSFVGVVSGSSGPTATFTLTPTNTPVVPTATPTKTPTPVVASTWRVNAGGPAYTATSGNVWSPDENFSGGSTVASGGTVTGTSDSTLYDTQRYGNNFSYTFNVPVGSYQVTLKFAETYSGDFSTGARVFNVAVNGTNVLSNLDVFAQVGANTQDDKVINNVSPVGGVITITFTGTTSTDANAMVEALQVIPMPAATATATKTNTPVPPTATATSTASSTPTASMTPTASLTATPSASPTKTNTLVPPTTTFTFTAVPPTTTGTQTPVPPTATRTVTPTNSATATFTSVPPTATPTLTPVPPTSTFTAVPPTATNTPAPPTATRTFTQVPPTSTFTPVPPTPTNTAVVSSGSFKVQLLSGVTSSNTNSPHPQIQIVNTGTGPLNLNNVTVRYWFNCDCTTQSLQAWVDWAGLMPSGANVTGNVQVSVVPTSLGGQTDYVLYGFTGNMVLQPGQMIQVQGRFNKSDWSNMSQSNDWSFAPYTSFTDAPDVTGYLSSGLVWGQQPAGTIAAALTASSALAFPNPSTGNGTTLSFTLGGSSTGVRASDFGGSAIVDPNAKITLGIYTLAGRLIWSQTLTGGAYGSTGTHDFYWNEKDLKGTGLANGIYLLKVTVESNGQTTSTIGKILILG